jgi:hypothetical protein
VEIKSQRQGIRSPSLRLLGNDRLVGVSRWLNQVSTLTGRVQACL